jgi:large subunit ribosomal protein L23
VRVLHVRSSITQGRATKNAVGQLKREKSTKYMTAQLLEPFVWPEDPWVKEGVREEDWDGFQRGTLEMTEEADRNNDVAMRYDKRMKGEGQKRLPGKEHRDTLAEQARRLLSGQDKWRPTWQAMGQEEFWNRKTGQQDVRR